MAVLGALLLASCTTIRIDPVTTDGVSIRYDRGRAIPTYSDDGADLSVQTELRRDDTMFKVTLKNKTDKTWRVSDTDFTVEASDDGQKWSPVRVFPSQEYYDRERNRFAAGVAMVALGAVVTDEPDVVTTRTTRVYGGPGGVVVQQTRVYREPGLRSVWLVDGYASSGMDWLNMLQNNLFYVKDLAPGEEYFGLVFSGSADAKYYRLTLKRDGKSPSVEFQKVKKKYNPFWPD